LKSFVTGATGRLGKVLIEEMLNRGWSVDAFALPDDDTSSLQDWGVRIFRGDITDPATLSIALQISAADILFHLAGFVQLGDLGTKENEDRMHEVNVIGTRNVLNSALQHNIKKAVYLSSVAIFAPSDENSIITENTQNGTTHPYVYGQTKYLAHQEAIKVREQGLQLIIFMPGVVFGPGFPGSMLFLERLKKGQFRYIPDTIADINIPLVFSRDLVQAVFAGLDMGRFGEQYILVESSPSFQNLAKLASVVGGNHRLPKPISYRKALFYAWFVETSAKLSRRTPSITQARVKSLFARVPSAKDFYQFDTSKVRTDLNWQPTALEDALGETIYWYSSIYRKNTQEGN